MSLWLVWGCTGDDAGPAGLELLIDADADLRSELDRVRLEGNGQVVELQPSVWPIPLAARPSASRPRAVLTIRGFHGATEVVRRTVDLKLDTPRDRRALTIYLTNSCRLVFEECDERDLGTCLPCHSRCDSAVVSQSSLPKLSADAAPLDALDVPECTALSPDGGAGDGSMPSMNDGQVSIPDGGHDAGSDAGPIDAGDSGTPSDLAWVPLAVARSHACAIRGPDRTVYCWGANEEGELGVAGEPVDWRKPVKVNGAAVPLTHVRQVAVGFGFSCALRDERRVVCWGARTFHQTGTRNVGLVYKPYPVVMAEGGTAPDYLPLENIVQIAAGEVHACAIAADGKVFCWGANDVRELGVTTSESSSNGAVRVPLPDDQWAVQVASSASGTCVATRADRLYCWGANDEGQAGSLPGLTDAGARVNTIVESPQEVTLSADAKPIKHIGGGWLHMMLLAENGSVWTWGNNYWGQLERGTTPCPSALGVCDPVPGAVSLPSAATAHAIGSSARHLCAVLAPSNQAWCGHYGFVMRPEADASVPIKGVTFVAGAPGGNEVSCLLTDQDDIYCHGAFMRADRTTDLDISEFNSGVKWSLPE